MRYLYKEPYISKDKQNEIPDQNYIYKNGFTNNSKAEVIRGCCDYFGTGMWFYMMPGSGIYYNVGNSLVFETKEDALENFCFSTNTQIKNIISTITDASNVCAMIDTNRYADNKFVPQVALQLGYDSIQYTNENGVVLDPHPPNVCIGFDFFLKSRIYVLL